jgi:outer membrane protein TolC
VATSTIEERVMNMHGTLRTAAAGTALLVLAGCATVDIDRAVAETNQALPGFTGEKLELSRTMQQREARRQLAAELLAQPLSMDGAVQLALANSPTVQALIAQGWNEMALAAQGGRIANPVFTFERLRMGSELELGRLLSIGLLDLITLPQRQALARNQVEQGRVQLATRIVEHVNAVRQAWVRAVAAQQSLVYAQQVSQAAEASAELARRMQQVGNFTRLQRARQQAFYADAAAQLAAATHARTAAREELVRQLGLDAAQAEQLKLPERLPDLPQQPRQPADLAASAWQQRLDVQLARSQLQVAGQAQGLDLLNRLVDVELGVRHDTVFDNAPGAQPPGAHRENRRGFELAVRLPLFDWGDATRAALNAQSLAAANRYDAVVRAASSQLRESYSAYRTAYDLAKHHRDEIVPLRKAISDENQLRYNGMLIGVFELLADARDQVAAVTAAVDALRQFWLADAGLASTLVGKPLASGATPVSTRTGGSDEAGH